MRNTLETRLGIFFALALVVAFIVLEVVGGFDFFKRGRHLHARFENVQELKEGDPVKMAGVEVGRVSRIELERDRVKVTMKIHENAAVKTDSTAMIRFAGLMGQNFVFLDFGSADAPLAADGAILTTKEQGDLNSLMVKLESVAGGVENLTKSFGGDNISNLLGPFTDFLKQNSPVLTAMFGNMKTISDQVARGQGTVGKLIQDETLYVTTLTTISNLQDTTTQIELTIADARAAITKANSIVDQINAGQGTLGKLAKDDTLYRETTTAMANLRQILDKINRGQGSVGQLVNDDSFLKNAKLSLQKLDKATESLEDTGPLSVLGTAVNSLF